MPAVGPLSLAVGCCPECPRSHAGTLPSSRQAGEGRGGRSRGRGEEEGTGEREKSGEE